jgi:hypothetical protein
MPHPLEGRLCLVLIKDKQERARIIKVFPKVGFSDHGEAQVSVVLERAQSIWDGDWCFNLRDVELLGY